MKELNTLKDVVKAYKSGELTKEDSHQTEVAQSNFFSTPIVNRVMMITCKK